MFNISSCTPMSHGDSISIQLSVMAFPRYTVGWMDIQRYVSSNQMKIRLFKPGDEQAVDEIWKKHHQDFSVPDRNRMIAEVIAEDEDGSMVAYGQVKLFAEAIMLIDKDASLRSKVEALKLLLLEAFRGTDQAGLQDLYCFCKDPEFATILSKHFSFEIVDSPGELLLRKV